MRLGVAAIARPTFDVPFAEATAQGAFAALDSLGDTTVTGPRHVVLDDAGLTAAAAELEAADFDVLVIVQASFADSTLVARLAATTAAPILLWAFPEDRSGGRLRLNSLCGINLAAYVLRAEDRDIRHLYADPGDAATSERLAQLLAMPPAAAGSAPTDVVSDEADREAADAVATRLASARIGIIGDRPSGFEPCDYDAAELLRTTGVTAEAVPLPQLFARGAAAPTDAVATVRRSFAAELTGTDDLDQDSLDQSVRLHLGLTDLVASERWDAVATRCWPECFTEFGGAACAPQSRLNQKLGVPGLCEADAYGAVTSLILQWLGKEPAFVADLIHLDPTDNTAVFWHCGLAPLSMADPATSPQATVHSNRRLPLLYEFPLKAGRVTIARLSQSRGRHRLVIGGAEMVHTPLPFSGTAGVARMDQPVDSVLSTVIQEGLEHHYGIVYGDVRGPLHALADKLDFEVVAL